MSNREMSNLGTVHWDVFIGSRWISRGSRGSIEGKAMTTEAIKFYGRLIMQEIAGEDYVGNKRREKEAIEVKMDKQSLRECIYEGLEAADNVPMTKEMDIDNGFVASFLAGWILGSIRYETVDLEGDKKGK